MVQAIRVANVPAEEFEKQVESANPPTVTKLAEARDQAAARFSAATFSTTSGAASIV